MIRSFTGHIVGLGTTSGTRLVIGIWDESEFGAFADVMIEDSRRYRILIAPTQQIADFVGSTYDFDEVRIEPVAVERGVERWSVHTRSLDTSFRLGGRLGLSRLLALVPPPLRRWPRWARLCNPIAGRIMPGVQTFGTAGNGRIEWYAARDVRHVTGVQAQWEGTDLGAIAPVTPPVRFGFASAPATPTLTSLTSYVSDNLG
jgi:hypothetical protein